MSDDGVSDPKALGRTVARLRKLRGLSQREFAAIVDRSETWLSQVERGVRRIDRMTVLQRLADALDVPVSELAPRTPVALGREPAEEATALTLALTSTAALAAALDEAPADHDRAAAEAAITEVRRQLDAGEFDKASERLTRLLPLLERGARAQAPTSRRAASLQLASAYDAYAAVLSALGDPAGAWVAGDRAVAAAERAGDPLLMAAGALRLTEVFHAARGYDRVLRAATSAVDALSARVASGDTEAAVLAGALRLRAAVAMARMDDADAAYGQLDEAGAVADRIGADRVAYGTAFGPAHVAACRVTVAVELGDAGAALRVAAALDPAPLSDERRAAYLVDVARAYAQRRNVAGVVRALTEARELARDLVEKDPGVHGLVTDLLRSGEEDDALHRLAMEMNLSF